MNPDRRHRSTESGTSPGGRHEAGSRTLHRGLATREGPSPGLTGLSYRSDLLRLSTTVQRLLHSDAVPVAQTRGCPCGRTRESQSRRMRPSLLRIPPTPSNVRSPQHPSEPHHRRSRHAARPTPARLPGEGRRGRRGRLSPASISRSASRRGRFIVARPPAPPDARPHRLPTWRASLRGPRGGSSRPVRCRRCAARRTCRRP